MKIVRVTLRAADPEADGSDEVEEAETPKAPTPSKKLNWGLIPIERLKKGLTAKS